MAIPKNFNDDHYFMFPGTVWRAFETGVLDKEFFTTVMRPVVRFVTRSPVAPPNPMPSPLPAIEALIEEHQLLKRIYRQRSGDDETAVIGELGEAISGRRRLCRYSGIDGKGPGRRDFAGRRR